ncbi:MAG: hypothetical protein IJI56_02505 [Firmicutes bacterium]|nr:hypothetical protein [Bacillota bacterium]
MLNAANALKHSTTPINPDIRTRGNTTQPIKAGSLATPTDDQASVNTPEANSGTAPVGNVTQCNVSVKKEADKEVLHTPESTSKDNLSQPGEAVKKRSQDFVSSPKSARASFGGNEV